MVKSLDEIGSRLVGLHYRRLDHWKNAAHPYMPTGGGQRTACPPRSRAAPGNS
jgi:hypothetical protein